MICLFLGEDCPSKDILLERLKQQYLPKQLEQFNLDKLYARDLPLKDLQEKLLCLPVKNPGRILIIKDAQNLREDVREFVLKYAKKPQKQILLILDIRQKARSDEFISQLFRYAKVYRFPETRQPDTFALGRYINLKKPDYALRILNQILKAGERPERILGGLRYSLERDTVSAQEARKKLKLLLDCDIEIKTGKLKPVFALEKLVINLCGPSEPFH